jgi:hypothetical protein
MNIDFDPYKILNVSKFDTPQYINDSYNRLVNTFNGRNDQLTIINTAYKMILSNMNNVNMTNMNNMNVNANNMNVNANANNKMPMTNDQFRERAESLMGLKMPERPNYELEQSKLESELAQMKKINFGDKGFDLDLFNKVFLETSESTFTKPSGLVDPTCISDISVNYCTDYNSGSLIGEGNMSSINNIGSIPKNFDDDLINTLKNTPSIIKTNVITDVDRRQYKNKIEEHKNFTYMPEKTISNPQEFFRDKTSTSIDSKAEVQRKLQERGRESFTQPSNTIARPFMSQPINLNQSQQPNVSNEIQELKEQLKKQQELINKLINK